MFSRFTNKCLGASCRAICFSNPKDCFSKVVSVWEMLLIASFVITCKAMMNQKEKDSKTFIITTSGRRSVAMRLEPCTTCATVINDATKILRLRGNFFQLRHNDKVLKKNDCMENVGTVLHLVSKRLGGGGDAEDVHVPAASDEAPPEAAPVEPQERPEPGRHEVETLVATDAEEETFAKVNWVWCTVCQCISKSGRSHRGQSGHATMSLKKREQECPGFLGAALQEFLRVRRHGKAGKRALVREKQQEDRDQKQAQVMPTEPGRLAASDVYRVRFGQHKNKTIAELFTSKDDGEARYIPYLFATRSKSGPQDNLMELELALKKEGFWDRTVNEARVMAPAVAELSVLKYEDLQRKAAEGQIIHPDVLQSAKLMVQKCREDAAASDRVGSAIAKWAEPENACKKRRLHRSKASVENTHCRYCGQMGHRIPSCPRAEQDALEAILDLKPVKRNAELVGTERQLHQIRQHLKYTWTDQRTETYNNKTRRCRHVLDVSGHDISRMSALDMVNFGLATGILVDQAGTACSNPNCEQLAQPGAQKNPGILGSLLASDTAHTVLRSTACYRCLRCTSRYLVNKGSPVLSLRDHMEDAVYIWWMFVNNATMVLTCLHMNRTDDYVRKHWRQAAQICAYDAVRRQRSIRFAGDGVHTLVVEADESRMGKFKTEDEGQLVHNHWVWLGVVTRGDPTAIW